VFACTFFISKTYHRLFFENFLRFKNVPPSVFRIPVSHEQSTPEQAWKKSRCLAEQRARVSQAKGENVHPIYDRMISRAQDLAFVHVTARHRFFWPCHCRVDMARMALIFSSIRQNREYTRFNQQFHLDFLLSNTHSMSAWHPTGAPRS